MLYICCEVSCFYLQSLEILIRKLRAHFFSILSFSGKWRWMKNKMVLFPFLCEQLVIVCYWCPWASKQIRRNRCKLCKELFSGGAKVLNNLSYNTQVSFQKCKSIYHAMWLLLFALQFCCSDYLCWLNTCTLAADVYTFLWVQVK